MYSVGRSVADLPCFNNFSISSISFSSGAFVFSGSFEFSCSSLIRSAFTVSIDVSPLYPDRNVFESTLSTWSGRTLYLI